MTAADKTPRQPTEIERAQEASILYSCLADTGVIALFVVVALMSGSMTMIGETIRGTLLLLAYYFGFWVMFATHRNRLLRFEFGVGKLEQLVAMITGLALIISGLWVATHVFEAVLSSREPASPFGLAAAAVINATNTAVNSMSWYAVLVASRDDDSHAYRSQLRSRFTAAVGSWVVQITLTVAALAKDGSIALVMDAGGAIFVVGMMLVNGTAMIAQALPDMLDAPATSDVGRLVRKTVARIVPDGAVLAIRTRRSGRTVFAEVAVGAVPASSRTLGDWSEEIERALEEAGTKVEIAIVPAPT